MNKTLILISAFALLVQCCNKTPKGSDPPLEAAVKMTIEDVGVSDSWLRVEIEQPENVKRLNVLRNDSTVLTVEKMMRSDTLLLDENLEPESAYAYQALIVTKDEREISDERRLINTLGITSSDFSWQSFSIEGATFMALSDVAIINENDIWACGYIYTEDTNRWNEDSTEWIDPYNAVHWDGEKWELKRIRYIYHGYPVFSSIDWMFAKNGDDIWFGNSVHWDGQKFHNIDLAIQIFTGIGVNRMWDSPKSELYALGNKGTVAYSTDNGVSWRKIESGTEMDLEKVSGSSAENLWISSWGIQDDHAHTVLLHYNGSQIRKVIDEPVFLYSRKNWISGAILGVFTDSPYWVWVYTHLGLYRCPVNSKGEGRLVWDNASSNVGTEVYKGQARNDQFAGGAQSVVMHYNGREFVHLADAPNIGTIYGLDIKGDILCYVSARKMVIGKRN